MTSPIGTLCCCCCWLPVHCSGKAAILTLVHISSCPSCPVNLQGLQEHLCASHDLFVYDFTQPLQQAQTPSANAVIRVACPSHLFDGSGHLQSLEAAEFSEYYNKVRVCILRHTLVPTIAGCSKRDMPALRHLRPEAAKSAAQCA